MIQKILAADKLPIVNLDLLNGFSRDRYAVNYLKRAGARGIISTHLDPLRHALSIGLYAVQRTFLLDSGAMDTITNQLKNTPVDALEVLPALVAPKILERVRAIPLDLPVVGGGLIQTLKEVEDLLAQGLSASLHQQPANVDSLKARRTRPVSDASFSLRSSLFYSLSGFGRMMSRTMRVHLRAGRDELPQRSARRSESIKLFVRQAVLSVSALEVGKLRQQRVHDLLVHRRIDPRNHFNIARVVALLPRARRRNHDIAPDEFAPMHVIAECRGKSRIRYPRSRKIL